MTEDAKKPWYADLPPDKEAEANAKYEESVMRICNGVKQASLSFEKAVQLVDIDNEDMKAAVVDDALKVLIAEMHFNAGKSLNELAKMLKLPLAQLEKARREMLQDVEQAAIEKYKEEQGGAGNA